MKNIVYAKEGVKQNILEFLKHISSRPGNKFFTGHPKYDCQIL